MASHSTVQRTNQYNKALYFLTGQQSLEEEEKTIKTLHPKARIPTFVSDVQGGRDFLRFATYYQDKVAQVEMIRTACQDLTPSHEIKDKEHRGYGPKWQPTATDHITLSAIV